ncbi:hypothetical protein [Coleofasciculus sp. FACHB-1120]|uniref:hypothetical protein n=1 Tax=Coleofasciculus sp. FACHB-1120 TaxID=2692783 RepID=UPI001688DD61|nr:hypothetical protein [Coleofasciculus sp. FACHB-1120]MBD2743231.1 hypothetical protein [Coleofasciculus sp. FACHB-1120]
MLSTRFYNTCLYYYLAVSFPNLGSKKMTEDEVWSFRDRIPCITVRSRLATSNIQ